MKISVISPVKNEADFIGYSVMSVLPYVHEILYGVAKSDDGTLDILTHIRDKYAGAKLRIYQELPETPKPIWDFEPMNMADYDKAYDYLIGEATGDAVWFLHPDMVVTNPSQIAKLQGGPLAWYVHMTSYAQDLKTKITSGRTDRWKNMHAKQFGLHYYGAYGSQNEDFYHRDITGDTYRHFGDMFELYPFDVVDSGIRVNHYCELKDFDRRLEKMKKCLKTQMPQLADETIDAMAREHPRVTLKNGRTMFGNFAFGPSADPIPAVFEKYSAEFGALKKEVAHA